MLYVRINKVTNVDTMHGDVKSIFIEASTDEKGKQIKSTSIKKQFSDINFHEDILKLKIKNYSLANIKISLNVTLNNKKQLTIGDFSFPVRAIPKNKQTNNLFKMQPHHTKMAPSTDIEFHYSEDGKKPFSVHHGSIDLTTLQATTNSSFSTNTSSTDQDIPDHDLLLILRSIPPQLLPAFQDPQIIQNAIHECASEELHS